MENKENTRIVNKLINWKKEQDSKIKHLLPPENFTFSWLKYDAQKRKEIIKKLVDSGILPTSFNKRKITDFGKTVTCTELLDGLTRQYASDKFKTN